MSAPTYFTHEAAILAALATVPALLVRTSVDADEAVNHAAFQPTAVIVFDADEVVQSKPAACLVRRGVSVYVFMQGATTERQPADGELLHQVWQALHGLEIPGYDEPLQFESSDAQLLDNLREYRLTFKTMAVLRKS